MSKFKVVMFALFALFAFSVVASAASAEEWLHENKKIETTAIAGLIDGTIFLEHTGGLGGTSKIECNGQFHGTFGPGKNDLISEVLSLGGSHMVDCKIITGACGPGVLALVIGEHLPWSTELVLFTTSTWIWDHIFEDSSHPNGLPAYEVTCLVGTTELKELCEGLVIARFDQNLANGALLLFRGAESVKSTKCNGGGSAVLSGEGEALSFTIS